MLFWVKASNGYELPSSLYKTSTQVIEPLEFVWSYRFPAKFSKPTKELIDHILRFSTSFVSESARPALVKWECKVSLSCVLVLEWTKACILVCRPFGVPGGSMTSHWPSGLVWSGDDSFVRGTWRPPSFVEKLLSGDGIEVTGDLAWALVANPLWQVKKSSGRDLVTGKKYS
jgi:hypothetical protein